MMVFLKKLYLKWLLFKKNNTFFSRRRERLWIKEFERARKKADRLTELDNRRYYVLPDWSGKLVAMNKKQIDFLKRKRMMGKQVNGYYLMKEALYFTEPKKKKDV
jgi:hypothetical protein